MNWEWLGFAGLCSATFLSIGIFMGKGLQPTLTQREVTLGDGTKATCIIVRDAGATCVPHAVTGPDAEDAP